MQKQKMIQAIQAIRNEINLDGNLAIKYTYGLESIINELPDNLASKKEHHKLIFDYQQLEEKSRMLEAMNKRLTMEVLELMNELGRYNELRYNGTIKTSQMG